MGQYRKKPVEVAAWRCPGVVETLDGNSPKWIADGIATDKLRFFQVGGGHVATNHGWVEFTIGDWIIRSPEGELYPATDAVFQATYEPVPDPGGATRTCSACGGSGSIPGRHYPQTCAPCAGTGRIAV